MHMNHTGHSSSVPAPGPSRTSMHKPFINPSVLCRASSAATSAANSACTNSTQLGSSPVSANSPPNTKPVQSNHHPVLRFVTLSLALSQFLPMERQRSGLCVRVLSCVSLNRGNSCSPTLVATPARNAVRLTNNSGQTSNSDNSSISGSQTIVGIPTPVPIPATVAHQQHRGSCHGEAERIPRPGHARKISIVFHKRSHGRLIGKPAGRG